MYKFTIFILFAVATTGVNGDANEGLRNFVTHSILEFDSWIRNEGLDPLPPKDQVFNMSFSNGLYQLQGTLSNVSIHGLSLKSEIYETYLINFLENNIMFKFVCPWAGLNGNYNASGMVLGNLPISGASTWNISSEPFILTFSETFTLIDGYIVLNQRDNDSWYGYSAEFEFRTENMTAEFRDLFTPDTSSYEAQIMADVASNMPYDVFGEYTAGVKLLYDYVHGFLQERFSATPVSDVIEWPYPDPEPTTRYAEPNITEPAYTTTMSPCNYAKKHKSSADTKSQGLNNFLMTILIDYPSYLVRNGLDPSPPIMSNVNLNIDSSFLMLSGNLSTSVGAGMSTNQVGFYGVNSDLVAASMTFALDFYWDLTLSGTYDLSGFIISTYPISGRGPWTLTNFRLGLYYSIDGFTFEDGYINVNNFTSRQIHSTPYLESAVMTMDDLVRPEDADGIGKGVLESLAEIVPRTLAEQGAHPIEKSVLDYLNFMFRITPLAEIINTPSPC